MELDITLQSPMSTPTNAQELTRRRPADSSSAPTQEIAQRPSLTQELASHYGIEPGKFIATLKATVMPRRQGGEASPVSDEELAAFCMVAKEYGLNPFLKEIHAYPNKSGGITPVVGVDGWSKMVNRQAHFDGIEFELLEDDNGKPVSVTAHIYVKGRSRPVSVTEYFLECQRGTEPWRQMPRRMLRHKALIQGARVAFGFCGIHDEDEANDIVNVTPPAAREKKPLFTTPKREAIPAVEVPTPTLEPAATEPEPDPAPPTTSEPADVAGPSELDEKRLAIRDAFADAGVEFAHFAEWMSKVKSRTIAAAGWETLEEEIVDLISGNLGAVVAAAKRWNGGAR